MFVKIQYNIAIWSYERVIVITQWHEDGRY
jgi:hypothetical protein